MRKNIIIIVSLITLLFAGSCSKEEKEQPKLDENGLTKEITDLVPQYILDEMRRLGMPIYGGANPPILTQGQLNVTYAGKPFILKSSNRPGDVPGSAFADYEVTFQQQNNNDLTIKVDYLNGPESGSGLGSYIVGDNCEFSVFVEVNATHSSGTNAKLVHVISGTLQPDGIADLYFANFMIDDYGDPQDVWIEKGQGRVAYDSDAFSELQGTDKTWYSSLPQCPCTYAEAQNLKETRCPSGEWSDCGSASDFHYGASYEIRWFPSTSGQAGQQCTYDANGKLITAGIAAGSPDKVSPRTCGLPSLSTCEHYRADVLPWGNKTFMAVCGGDNSDIIPCWQYLRDWPANNSLACTINKVSGIDHMLLMIGDMSCEEASLLIRKAKESPVILIDSELRSYIIGEPISLSTAQLVEKLQNWKNLNSCPMFPTDELCVVISKAIINLE